MAAEAADMDAEIKRLRGLSITRTWPDGQPRSNSNQDRTSKLAAQIADLQTMYEEKIQALVERQIEIEKAIDRLDPIERRLIRLRYIDCNDWDDICDEIVYSERQMFNIHGIALEKLKRLQ